MDQATTMKTPFEITKLPGCQVPGGLKPWIELVREALSKKEENEEGGQLSVEAMVFVTEPRHYDDQEWHKSKSDAFTRASDKMHRHYGPNGLWRITSRPDYPKFKRAIAQAASSIDARSGRYVLDVGMNHAVLYHGYDGRERPAMVQGGTTMREAGRHAEVATGLAGLAKALRPGESAALTPEDTGPEGWVPAHVLREAGNSVQWGRNKIVRLHATKLLDGTTVLHAPGLEEEGTAGPIGTILAANVLDGTMPKQGGNPAGAAGGLASLPLFA